MKLRWNHKITIMLILMVVIGFSVTSCFMFFMDWSGEERVLIIDEDFNEVRISIIEDTSGNAHLD